MNYELGLIKLNLFENNLLILKISNFILLVI